MEEYSQPVTIKLHGGKELRVSRLPTVSQVIAILVLSCCSLAALHSAPVLAKGCNPRTLLICTDRQRFPLPKAFLAFKKVKKEHSGEKCGLKFTGNQGSILKLRT